MLRIVPVSLTQAKQFVAKHHRHNKPSISWKFGAGIEQDGQLVGVVMAGRPVARMLDSQFNIEITRVCTLNVKNANSALYGSVLRAAKALGYQTAYTYTLASESGASLKAAGFSVDTHVPARSTWSCNSRHRVQVDLFGNQMRPPDEKIRWIRKL